jgi:CheY-like chemotaxis protein
VKILIVEDNEDNLNLATKILVHAGHLVECARNGREAVELLAGHAKPWPDLVLMDLGMPIMDGWAATRAIRALPDGDRLPVVALTAHAVRAEDRTKAAEAGCSDYITKPFDRRSLLKAIERYEPNPAGVLGSTPESQGG